LSAGLFLRYLQIKIKIMIKNKNLLYGYIAICISVVLWGISFVWTKGLLNNNFPVFTIVTVRIITASIFLFIIFKINKGLEKIRKKDIKTFFLLALFEPFLYFIGEDFGLKYVDASFAAIIIALIPIVTTITLHFFYKDKLKIELLIGAIISVTGVVIMSLSKNNTFDFSVKGLMLLLLAVVTAAGYSVILQKLLKSYGPVTITTYQNIFAIVFYLPMFFIFDFKSFSSLNWSFSNVRDLLCLAILCSAVAYALYSYSAKVISVAKVSIFTNLIPIITIIFSYLIGQETISFNKVLGIIIVVLGVILSQSNIINKKKV
jgi:drug/metabolite transporter (DMT)-like permease